METAKRNDREPQRCSTLSRDTVYFDLRKTASSCKCVYVFLSNYVPIYFSVFFIISPFFFFFSKSKSLTTSHNVLFIVRFNSDKSHPPAVPKIRKNSKTVDKYITILYFP